MDDESFGGKIEKKFVQRGRLKIIIPLGKCMYRVNKYFIKLILLNSYILEENITFIVVKRYPRPRKIDVYLWRNISRVLPCCNKDKNIGRSKSVLKATHWIKMFIQREHMQMRKRGDVKGGRFIRESGGISVSEIRGLLSRFDNSFLS